MIVLILLVVAVGGLVEIVPLFFQKSTTEAGRGRRALDAAAARRPRHLRARGLLQLPLADDPAVPRRDAALRPLLGGRRVRLRPPVPVGQQAHRARPAPRGRQVQRRVAPHPPEQPARRGARVEHAGLSLAREDAGRRRRIAAAHAALRRVGVPYTDAADRKARRPKSRARPRWTRSSLICSRSAWHSSKREPASDGHITTLRIAATLVSFVTFIGILVWACSRRNARKASKRRPHCPSSRTTP